MLFNSQVTEIARVVERFDDNILKNETMLFSADYNFARRNGDIITQSFLDKLPEDWKKSKIKIDSRVHMLMNDWYPCIPGWHHDDIPRTRSDRQPNYEKLDYESEHIMMVVNADVAPTQFIVGEMNLDIPPVGSVIYDIWNREINTIIPHLNLFNIHLKEVEDCVVYHFDWQAFHRGTAAVKKGWRMFIRASRYSDDVAFQIRPYKNEIRRQAQVYLSALEAGW